MGGFLSPRQCVPVTGPFPTKGCAANPHALKLISSMDMGDKDCPSDQQQFEVGIPTSEAVQDREANLTRKLSDKDKKVSSDDSDCSDDEAEKEAKDDKSHQSVLV